MPSSSLLSQFLQKVKIKRIRSCDLKLDEFSSESFTRNVLNACLWWGSVSYLCSQYFTCQKLYR